MTTKKSIIKRNTSASWTHLHTYYRSYYDCDNLEGATTLRKFAIKKHSFMGFKALSKAPQWWKSVRAFRNRSRLFLQQASIAALNLVWLSLLVPPCLMFWWFQEHRSFSELAHFRQDETWSIGKSSFLSSACLLYWLRSHLPLFITWLQWIQ